MTTTSCNDLRNCAFGMQESVDLELTMNGREKDLLIEPWLTFSTYFESALIVVLLNERQEARVRCRRRKESVPKLHSRAGSDDENRAYRERSISHA